MAQTSPRPKFAPAAPDVASAPASMNPPVAVRIPSVSPRSFFMRSALGRLLQLLVGRLPEVEQSHALLGPFDAELWLGDLEAPLGLEMHERFRIDPRVRQ